MIEILVTLAVFGILSAVMIAYSTSSGEQTLLLTTRESIVQLINRAKANSLAAYSTNNPDLGSGMATCGYGVHFDPSTGALNVFESEASSTDACASRTNFQFASGTDVMLTSSLDAYNIDLSQFSVIPDTQGDLTDVVFTSPNTQTYIYTTEDQSGNANTGGINLQLVAGNNTNNTIEVDVNNSAQISSE